MENSQNIIKKCEICQSEATSICFKCYNYLCESCFKFIHDKKPNQEHKKEKIDYFVPIDIKCKVHPKHIIDFYCVDEIGNSFKINYIFFYFIRIMLCSLPL